MVDPLLKITHKQSLFLTLFAARASVLSSEIDSLLSGTGNSGTGDSNGDSGTRQTEPPYKIIDIIGGAVIVFVVVGIVVAGQLLGWSEPARKRRYRNRKR